MKDLILVRRSAAPLGAAFGSALLPETEKDDAALAKIPMGEAVALKLVRDRSLPQMRLFWALLDKVATASRFENAERLLVALKIRLGRYDLLAMPNGKAVPVPHSISFAAMEHGDFTKFFEDSVRLICTEVIPGTDAGALIREVEEMLGAPPEPRPTREQLDYRSQERIERWAGPMPAAPVTAETESERAAGEPQRRHRRTKVAEMPVATSAGASPGLSVTGEPPPEREDLAQTYSVVDWNGEVRDFDNPTDATNHLGGLLTEAAARGPEAVAAVRFDNEYVIRQIEHNDPEAYDKFALAPPQLATTERPDGLGDALEEAERQGGLSSTSSPRPDYRVEPNYNKAGDPGSGISRAWWIALLGPKLRAAPTRQNFLWRLEDNADLIASYKATLEPPGIIGAMAEIEDLGKPHGVTAADIKKALNPTPASGSPVSPRKPTPQSDRASEGSQQRGDPG